MRNDSKAAENEFVDKNDVPVGTNFEHGGEKFRVEPEKSNGCDDCDFFGKYPCPDVFCGAKYRADKTSVIFKRVANEPTSDE